MPLGKVTDTWLLEVLMLIFKSSNWTDYSIEAFNHFAQKFLFSPHLAA